MSLIQNQLLSIDIYFEKASINFDGEKVSPDRFVLPVNPNELTIKYSTSASTTTIHKLGEVQLLQGAKLYSISLKGFFPSVDQFLQPYVTNRTTYKTPDTFNAYFVECIQTKTPIRLVVPYYDLNCLMAIQSYHCTRKGAEYRDVYFDMELKQFKHFNTKFAKIKKDAEGKDVWEIEG